MQTTTTREERLQRTLTLIEGLGIQAPVAVVETTLEGFDEPVAVVGLITTGPDGRISGFAPLLLGLTDEIVDRLAPPEGLNRAEGAPEGTHLATEEELVEAGVVDAPAEVEVPTLDPGLTYGYI